MASNSNSFDLGSDRGAWGAPQKRVAGPKTMGGYHASRITAVAPGVVGGHRRQPRRAFDAAPFTRPIAAFGGRKARPQRQDDQERRGDTAQRSAVCQAHAARKPSLLQPAGPAG